MSDMPFREGIADCCKQLRLSSNLAEHAMTATGESNQEYLYHLLRDEAAYRGRERIKKLLSSANFPKPYAFAQFKPDEVVFPAGCPYEALQSMRFLDERMNLLMYGSTGTGKTMLSRVDERTIE